MSQAILNGDVTVYFLDDGRQKRLEWTGSATGTRTMNELYSACADLMDENTQMDDGSIMSAETPTEYTIGIIDAGDDDPWYISYECMQHLTGGALKTAGWTHTDDSATGIVVVPTTGSGSTIVDGDVGNTISGATTGNGTLLEVLDVDNVQYLVVRPSTSAAANNFTTDLQTITCNGHTATQGEAYSCTGEQIWANLYSIGTIEADTHIYVYQGAIGDGSRSRIYDITDTTQDWWSDGHVDRCFFTKDFTSQNYDVIDGGYFAVYARKYGTLYDNYSVPTSLVSGGRNPIPLATSPDLDNTTGYKSITTTAVGDDDFEVGDEIEGQSSGARAIITAITGSDPTFTFHYFLIDDPLTDFQTAAETIDNNDGNGTATKDANPPTDQGPASAGWFSQGVAPAASYTAATYDVDDDGTLEGYGITIDCKENPLDEVYEWIKYITRRGNTDTGDTDGIEGEQYVGGMSFLKYTGSPSGAITEGDDVIQETSGATGVIISHDTTRKEILLRNVRGTFATGASDHTLTDNDTLNTVEIDSVADNFAAKKAAPLGTFAGGTFFGARGVLLANWNSTDENSFQLTDGTGVLRQRPVAISIEVTNLSGGAESADNSDHVAVFRLDGVGGQIDKTEYSAVGGESIGDATIDVDSAIATDVPGKSTGGVLHVRDADDNNKQYRLRYSGWSGSTFYLANIASTNPCEVGTDTDTVVINSAFVNAKRGDLVYNHTRTAVSYVETVDDDNQITISPPITGQSPGDDVELNCVPISMNTADDVYIPLIDKFAAGSTATVSIVYSARIDYRVKVRNTRATNKIKPFVTDDFTVGTDRSVACIRTPDTIIS